AKPIRPQGAAKIVRTPDEEERRRDRLRGVRVWRIVVRMPENKAAAESAGRSRRRYLHRFAASARLRSRLRLQRRAVPNRHDAGRTDVGQAISVRAEGQAAAEAAWGESEELSARVSVPQRHRFVLDGVAGQALAIRAEEHPADIVAVPLEGKEFFAGAGV